MSDVKFVLPLPTSSLGEFGQTLSYCLSQEADSIGKELESDQSTRDSLFSQIRTITNINNSLLLMVIYKIYYE